MEKKKMNPHLRTSILSFIVLGRFDVAYALLREERPDSRWLPILLGGHYLTWPVVRRLYGEDKDIFESVKEEKCGK